MSRPSALIDIWRKALHDFDNDPRPIDAPDDEGAFERFRHLTGAILRGPVQDAADAAALVEVISHEIGERDDRLERFALGRLPNQLREIADRQQVVLLG